MQIQKELIKNRTSWYLLVSRDLMKHLDIDIEKHIKEGTSPEVIIQDDTGNKGNFVSFWKGDDDGE